MTNNKLSVNKQTRSRKTIAALVIAGLMSATALSAATSFIPVPTANAAATTIMNQAPRQGFADLVEQILPSVVSVEVMFQPVASPTFEQGNNPFEEFFKRRGGDLPKFKFKPGRKTGAQGSGFFISEDGYVVTNNHVVKNASKVSIKLNNGERFTAKVIGTDPKTDLALLKVDADRKFPAVKLAAKDPRVGDWVVAVGNPFGLGGTVTTGIVSARGRDIGSGPYDNFLQIDASINRGNSGGPAFNLNGEVIGVNTAIFSPSGGSVGIGFAIPASTTRQIVESLKENGSVTRGWLGVQIQTVTKDIAQSLGLDKPYGTIIAGVSEDSPAMSGGLKTGDTILKANGDKVKDARDLARKVARVAPGSVVDFEVLRSGEHKTIKVKIGKMPGSEKQAALMSGNEGKTLTSLGLALAPADDGKGVVVRKVDPDGKAAEKGIRPGDVIAEIGGIAVDDITGAKAAIKRVTKAGKKSVLLLIKSKNRQRFVALPVSRS